MRLHHVAWMLVFTLCCITSVLGYREWQRYCGAGQIAELNQRVEVLEEGPSKAEMAKVLQQVCGLSGELILKVKALEAEERPCEKYTGMVRHSCMQTIANIANICAIAHRTERVNDRLSDLIDKLSAALPSGAYILPQKAEMDKFNPRVVLPPPGLSSPVPREDCPTPAPIAPNPFNTLMPLPSVGE